MKKKWLYIIAASIAVIALAVAGAIYYYNLNNYIAKVGNEKISKTEFTFFLNLTRYQFEEELKIEDWKSKVGNQTAEEAAKDAALERAREYKIELINAKEKKITLSKEDQKGIDEYFDRIIENEGSRVNAENTVKQELGITLSEYKAIYRNISLTQKLKAAKMDEIKPTDDEAKKFYDENQNLFEAVTVRHVLFLTTDESGNPLPEDKQKEAEKNANDILAKVNAGQDIGALAKQYSQDPGSKDKNGEYTFGRGQMTKEFEDWSFGHKPGDTGVVKTDYGYHVIRLMDKKTTPFEDVKENIKGSVKEQKYSNQLEDLKKESRYNIVKNQRVYESIRIA